MATKVRRGAAFGLACALAAICIVSVAPRTGDGQTPGRPSDNPEDWQRWEDRANAAIALSDDSSDWMPVKKDMLIGPYQSVWTGPGGGLRLRILSTGHFENLSEKHAYTVDSSPAWVVHVVGKPRMTPHHYTMLDLTECVATLERGGATLSRIYPDPPPKPSQQPVLEPVRLKGFLGIYLHPVTGTKPHYGVHGTFPGGPASDAKLLPGDVLVSVNGITIPSPRDEGTGRGQLAPAPLEAVLSELPGDQPVRLVLDRLGKQVSVKLTPVPRVPSLGHVVTNVYGPGHYRTLLLLY